MHWLVVGAHAQRLGEERAATPSHHWPDPAIDRTVQDFTDLFAEGADLLSRVTGWNVTPGELQTVAQRIVTAKKLFNIREGWTSQEDTLPTRFLSENLSAGPSGGARLPRERLQEMIQAYYAARGWDGQGRVPKAAAEALHLIDLSGY